MSSLPLPSPAQLTPSAALPSWLLNICQAEFAENSGEINLAFRRCQSAWLTTYRCAEGDKHPQAEECLSTLVSHHLHLAKLLSTEGEDDEAAETLADVHQKLLHFIADQPPGQAWSKAALHNARTTHRALLAQLSECGLHPAIQRALRAGCLSIHLPAVHLH